MRSPRLLPHLLVATVPALLLLGLAGCGQQSPSSNPTPTVSTTASGTATGTPIPSHTPAPSPTTPSTTPPAGAPKPASLLLPAGSLPGFTPSWSWSEQSTGPERGPVGICQRFPMRTIGADKTVVRRFVPAGNLTGGTGAHLVSTFVDDKSASQAMAILHTWHERCGERLTAYDKKRVGPVITVPTAKGTATRYLVSYSKQGTAETTYDDLGVLRSGATVELVQLELRGHDYTAPDPMTKALQNAADRLP